MEARKQEKWVIGPTTGIREDSADGNKIYLESEEVERVGAKILEPGD